MKVVKYLRHEFHGEPEAREAALPVFVYDIPYLGHLGIFPDFFVLNEIFLSGGGDGGMGPGASWEPFSISEEEYEQLLDALEDLDPATLGEEARYTDEKLSPDISLGTIRDQWEWMQAVGERHGAEGKRVKAFRLRLGRLPLKELWDLSAHSLMPFLVLSLCKYLGIKKFDTVQPPPVFRLPFKEDSLPDEEVLKGLKIEFAELEAIGFSYWGRAEDSELAKKNGVFLLFRKGDILAILIYGPGMGPYVNFISFLEPRPVATANGSHGIKNGEDTDQKVLWGMDITGLLECHIRRAGYRQDAFLEKDFVLDSMEKMAGQAYAFNVQRGVYEELENCP
ncbi:hypothetical protein LZ24_00151 [Desulfobotulus alkaliphilus]|uniref:Uncharacterized protein n=1 Tax=Desulfobotulus alkaliphilus TaxID=622671 RepID=A0A562SA05_9BACT|nr:hypothetical protein [Desulfobotulus alkaliphilus]TWI77346.1 hypothetical protein LZ24_00151 [Desulfobotulus alkaliphilus]